MSDIPTSLRYTEDHLWVRHEAGDGVVRVGITDFAQRSLGDVVAVTPPKVGTTVSEQFGRVLDADAYRNLTGS